MTRRVRLACLCVAIAAGASAAAPPADRPTIWDLELGTAASELPSSFAEFACGSAGGPPGRPLTGFADYSECPPDARGLREVYFRYDDEPEYVARALEQARALEFYAGTRVLGAAVTASALFDSDGILRGIRLATDPRGAEPGERNDHWLLAPQLMQRFGSGWDCTSASPVAGESPVAGYYVNETCTKSANDVSLTVSRAYLHRRGQVFVDEFGKAQPTHFVSTTDFLMLDSKVPE